MARFGGARVRPTYSLEMIWRDILEALLVIKLCCLLSDCDAAGRGIEVIIMPLLEAWESFPCSCFLCCEFLNVHTVLQEFRLPFPQYNLVKHINGSQFVHLCALWLLIYCVAELPRCMIIWSVGVSSVIAIAWCWKLPCRICVHPWLMVTFLEMVNSVAKLDHVPCLFGTEAKSWMVAHLDLHQCW